MATLGLPSNKATFEHQNTDMLACNDLLQSDFQLKRNGTAYSLIHMQQTSNMLEAFLQTSIRSHVSETSDNLI